MQSGGGQYGVPGIQQFMEGCSSHGLFAALAASSSHDTINTNTHHHIQSQHNINQHHHHHLQQQNQSFSNQRLQQQQQQLGLQAAVAEVVEKTRARDLSDKANKIFGFSDTGGGGGTISNNNVQSAADQIVSPLATLQQQQQQQLTDDDGDGERGGGGINRWPMEETLALLKIRSQMDSNFRDSNLKGPLWENVSRKLAELGYHRSAKKCKEKFENVNKYHKKTKDGRMGRQDGKSYRFFNELEALSNTIRHHLGNQVTGFSDAQEGDRLHQSIVMAETSNAALNVSSDTNNTSEDDEYNDNNTINNNNNNNINNNNINVISDPPPSTRIKKRKRKQHFSSMAIFFESLVKQLMERQEELHRKFLETIERKEQERLNREEAWRRQEMARLTRETELRAQEQALANTREAALIAFLQKITGEDIKLPMPSDDIIQDVQQEDQQEKDGMSDPCNGRRWPKPEVHALIRLRSGLEAKFQEPGVKGPLWEEISSGMACLGFHRSSKRCKEKWENINKYFRKTKDSMKKRPENAKTCPYFHQLDALYGKGLLASSSSLGTSKGKGGHGHASDGAMHEQAPCEDHEINDKDNNGEDEDEGQAQTRSDSELLAMIPGDSQAGQGGANNGPDLMKTNAEHFFQEDHPSHQSPKRFKSNSNQRPISLGSSFDLSGSSKLEASSDSQKKAAKMERLVREMFEMQQQKFLDDFERREREQDIRQQGNMNKHDQNRQNQHHHQQQQGDVVQDERSQSALMALVHKLTVNASDYASQ